MRAGIAVEASPLQKFVDGDDGDDDGPGPYPPQGPGEVGAHRGVEIGIALGGGHVATMGLGGDAGKRFAKPRRRRILPA